MHMVVAEQAAMPVVMPAVMGMPFRMAGVVVILVMIMAVRMVRIAMVVLAFAHGAASVQRQGNSGCRHFPSRRSRGPASIPLIDRARPRGIP